MSTISGDSGGIPERVDPANRLCRQRFSDFDRSPAHPALLAKASRWRPVSKPLHRLDQVGDLTRHRNGPVVFKAAAVVVTVVVKRSKMRPLKLTLVWWRQ